MPGMIARWGGFAAVLLVAAIRMTAPAAFDFLDNRIYDLWVRGNEAPRASGLPVIVDIDDKSLSEKGQWPWPRYLLADLVDAISAQKPLSASIDILFAEPDRTSLNRILAGVERHYSAKVPKFNLPEYMDNDRTAARALASGPYVLPFFLTFANPPASTSGMPRPLNVAHFSSTPDMKPSLLNATGAVVNIPSFSEAVTIEGFMNARPDDDGVVRRVPLVASAGDRVYPSLPLASLLKATGTSQLGLVSDGGRLTGVRLKATTIPVDPRGNMLIRYGDRFERLSAGDLMAGRIPPGRLTDRIVFVGTSAAGLADLKATPVDPVMPGVEIHATIVENILTGSFLYSPTWSKWWVLLSILVLGGLGTWVTWAFSPRKTFAYLLVSTLIIWGSSSWCFTSIGAFLPPAAPLVALGLGCFIQTSVRFWLSEVELRRRTMEVALTQDATIRSLAALAEYRDPETGGHLERTREYVKLLAQTLSNHPKHKDTLTPYAIDWLTRCAVLHDMGKVAIPDSILLKPGELDEDEYAIMQKHPEVGGKVVAVSAETLGSEAFVKFANEVASTHHENWDGSGYPKGLKGEEIPLAGRLMALADIYDAIISKRAYKPPMPHDDAVKFIEENEGVIFDPDVVEAFRHCHGEFKAAALKFADNDEERRSLSIDDIEPSSNEMRKKKKPRI